MFDTGREVFRGKGDDQSSSPFTMNGPFVLTWTLIDQPPSKAEDRKYRKPFNPENPAWISLRVFDAETQKNIEWETKTGMTGNLEISRGGTFYLMATTFDNVAWIIRAKEGKLLITEKGETIVPTTAAERDRAAGKASRQTPVTTVPAPAPAPSPVPSAPRSTWDGSGLPPGMQKK